MIIINMFFHGSYIINPTICNQSFFTPSVHGKDFKTNIIIVTNNISHDLVMI
jgi:hypothetical protein